MSQDSALTENQVDSVRRALLMAGFSVADVNLLLFATDITEGVAVKYGEFAKALSETARKLRTFELQLLKQEFPNPTVKVKSKSKSKHQRRKERGW